MSFKASDLWIRAGRTLLAITAILSLNARASAAIPVEPGGDISDAVVYAALGASDAVGVGASAPEEGWVPKVYQRMPSGTRLLNLGESGTLLSQARVRQLPRAIAARPEVVTIWLAVNDFNYMAPLGQYSNDLDLALRDLRETGAKVYVGNLPDLSLLPWVPKVWRPAMQEEVMRWNAEIERVARARGAEVVDLFAERLELADHPEYLSIDGFHPSSKGYSRIADLFWKAMSESRREQNPEYP